jgi:hypothetical protein
MSEKAKWTFMVYMAGDNNLSTAGDKDLAEMRQVGSSAEVNIIVQFDNAGDYGTQRYRALAGGQKDLILSLGETDSGDPEVINEFIAWVKQEYPAERYALVLWSHGSAWEPSEVDKIARSVNATTYSPKEASDRVASVIGKTIFRTSLERYFGLSLAERAICVDDGSGHSLDTLELEKVLANAKHVLGQDLDLLGMDACLMSNLEVAFQVKPYVKFLVASEESEPNDGWPYERILRRLVDQPDLPSQQVAQNIVRDYIDSYVERGYQGDVTQTALDLARIDEITGSLDTLAEILTPELNGDNRINVYFKIWQAAFRSRRFWGDTLLDLDQLVQELNKQSVNPEVSQACEGVAAALGNGQGRFITAVGNHGKKVANCGGLTIYLPFGKPMSRFYPELAYAARHRWASLVEAYQVE